MVLSPESGEDAHPFWYTQVLGVFYAQVLHTDPVTANKSIQNIEFLWVCWLGLILPHTDSLVFGFLWTHGAAILSQLSLMERPLTCSQSCTVLLDHW